MTNPFQIQAAALCTAMSFCSLTAAGDSYSPYAGEAFPRQVFWGDTHLHSSYSVDASSAGNVNLDPAAAYRFAGGEAVTAHNGMQVQLIRPLDFLVVSDHAEYLGMMPQLRAGNPEILGTPIGKRWFDMLQGDDDTRLQMVMEVINSMHEPKIEAPAARRSAWQSMLEASDEYNEPGRFTALSGYEWTSMPDRGSATWMPSSRAVRSASTPGSIGSIGR